MEIKQRIEVAKVGLRKAENLKIQAETQKAAAEKQEADVVQQMAAEGVAPETINAEIGKLEAKLDADLTKVEQLIPKL